MRYETANDPVSDLSAALGERRRQAAEMLATGRQTTVQVARELKITDRTILTLEEDADVPDLPPATKGRRSVAAGPSPQSERGTPVRAAQCRDPLGGEPRRKRAQTGQRQGGGRDIEDCQQHQPIAETPAETGRERNERLRPPPTPDGMVGGHVSRLSRYQIRGFRYRDDVAGADDLDVRRFLPPRPPPGR